MNAGPPTPKDQNSNSVFVLRINDRQVWNVMATNLTAPFARTGPLGGAPMDFGPTARMGDADAPATERRIENGDEAVFRINVMRGIVRTTAYLVPDDGVKDLFGSHFADQFYVAQVTLSNPNQQPILVYGNTLRLVVRMTAAHPFELGEDGLPARRNWWATYQPMDYKAVLLMLERSDSWHWRSQVVKYMDAATKAAGFATLYTTSLDLAKGIAFFAGTIQPAARDFLLEDLKKNQENFQKVGLNPTEEIQPGASLTKYVFLPKGPIYGDYAYDPAEASSLPTDAKNADAKFSSNALRPTFIYNIRREEAYVEGKRILASDPLSSVGGK